MGTRVLLLGSPILVVAAMSAGAWAQVSLSAGVFHEEVVGQVSPGSEVDAVWASSKHRVAWVERNAQQHSVWFDGQRQGASYDDVRHLRSSPDEGHLVFAGGRGGKWSAVIDGVEQPAKYVSITGFSFEPRGNSLAFGACMEKKKCQLIVDGEPRGRVYEDMSFPRHSSGGERLAYLGYRGKRWIAVVDGQELGPSFKHPEAWGFGGGDRFFLGGLLDRTSTYAVDGVAGPGFAAISPITFSADGAHYAYGGVSVDYAFGTNKTQGTIVVDGRARETYAGSGFGEWWKAFGNVQETMTYGILSLSPAFHGISDPVFVSGDELAHAASRGERDVVVLIAGEPGPAFDDVLGPVISSDEAQRVAYLGLRGDEFLEMYGNRAGAVYRPEERSFPNWVITDCSGNHLAYEVVSGNDYKAGLAVRASRRVVVDGGEGPQYRARAILDFEFSADGAHYWYAVHDADGFKSRIVVDGLESRLYDFVGYVSASIGEQQHARSTNDAGTAQNASACGAGITQSQSTLRFIAREGERLLKVSYAIKEP